MRHLFRRTQITLRVDDFLVGGSLDRSGLFWCTFCGVESFEFFFEI